MAGDLIPPPSPAGRPSPDAMRLAGRRAHASHEDAAQAAEPAAAVAAPSPFRSRFGFVLGALLGITVAAGVTFFALLGSSTPDPAGAPAASDWSAWYPPTHDIISASSAIANHVQTEYKREDGKQLVSVHGGPFFYVNNGVALPFGIKLQPADGTILDLGSNGVFYTLTGTGRSGRINGDKATMARHRLLRREALELALYSFRYVDHISMFVALLPLTDPAASAKAVKDPKKRAALAKQPPQLQALFFRARDLRRQLQSPLSSTLASRNRLRPSMVAGPESGQIDKLTKGKLFIASFQQQPDGQLYLVLDRSSKPG